MTTPNELSDAALGIFAFAIYHQLDSGEPVTRVVADDGKGHRANPAGVEELQQRELGSLEDGFISFTPAGMQMIEQLIGRLRAA